MPKILVLIVAAGCLGLGVANAKQAQRVDWGAQSKQLKVQQKRERHDLKVQQRNIKKSWKNSHLTGATRTYAKHQMQRANRDLKTKQRDQRQDIKDRQKTLRERQREYGQ